MESMDEEPEDTNENPKDDEEEHSDNQAEDKCDETAFDSEDEEEDLENDESEVEDDSVDQSDQPVYVRNSTDAEEDLDSDLIHESIKARRSQEAHQLIRAFMRRLHRREQNLPEDRLLNQREKDERRTFHSNWRRDKRILGMISLRRLQRVVNTEAPPSGKFNC